MKILSASEGDGLMTNAEVREWLQAKKFETPRRDVPDGVIKPPSSTAAISALVQKYIESSPAGNVTVRSIRSLYEKLGKFKISAVEMLLIANIRPDSYAQLTPLIVDVYSRYDEDQLYEIIGIVNETLEKRTPSQPEHEKLNGEGPRQEQHADQKAAENEEEQNADGKEES